MAQSTITTPNVVCLDVSTGDVKWAKNPDDIDTYPIMSVTKAFTVYYILSIGAFPDRTITRPMASGPTTPEPGRLAKDDVVSVNDEIYASLLYSDNSATTDLALWSIGQTHTSWLGAQYLPEATEFFETEFGWTGFDYATPSGLGYVYFSARMVAEMGAAILTNQPWQVGVMSTPTYTTTVGGPNARTLTMDYLGGPIKAAVEAGGGVWLGSKSGSGTSTYAQVILWQHPTDTAKTYSIGLVGAPSTSTRDADITAVVADVLADEGVGPDPDPPTGSGLYRTSGDPVALARTNGNPVTLTI